MREGHPVLWSLAEPDSLGRLVLDHPYFEREEPTVWDDESTYVEANVKLIATRTHQWNHGLGEIVSALLSERLVVTSLEEHDSVPYDALPGLMERLDDGEYRLRDRPWRLPHSYTLTAAKPRP